MSSVIISTRREDISVNVQFTVSPTTLCTSQISLCVRQMLCVSWRLWSNRDDTCHSGRMFIDGIRDRILVGSETINRFFQIRGKHWTHIFNEGFLIDWRVLTILHSMQPGPGLWSSFQDAGFRSWSVPWTAYANSIALEKIFSLYDVDLVRYMRYTRGVWKRATIASRMMQWTHVWTYPQLWHNSFIVPPYCMTEGIWVSWDAIR